MGGFTIDMSEVRKAASDMRAAPANAAAQVKPIVSKGALNIKEQLRAEAGDSGWFRFARSISYDLTDGGFGAEIGPVKGSPGSIANIAYFGGANGGGGTIADPLGALEAESARFTEEVGKLVEKLVFG